MWFLMPSTDSPTGGINNCYRICAIAEELGIKARVISDRPYPHCDPEDNKKYWKKIERGDFSPFHFDCQEIREGDLVIQAELYPIRFLFSKPVRRIVFVQNWALMSEWAGWQEHMWTYNNWTHLTYCIETFNYTDYIRKDPMPNWRPADWQDTQKMVMKKKCKWSAVTPYFDFDNYEPGLNDPQKILFLPRKMGNHEQRFRDVFGDKLIAVDEITPAELRQLYRQIGIFLILSPSEGLAFPPIEALLSGCSVVSWKCGAPEDYLINGETAMLSEFGDFEQLIQNVKFLLENRDEQSRLSLNGRNLVKCLYTKERTKLELYMAYHAALTIAAN